MERAGLVNPCWLGAGMDTWVTAYIYWGCWWKHILLLCDRWQASAQACTCC